MRAWQVKDLGDPEQALELAEVEEPRPQPGEAVIAARTAALNFFDILLCRGDYQKRGRSCRSRRGVRSALETLGSRSTYGKTVMRPND